MAAYVPWKRDISPLRWSRNDMISTEFWTIVGTGAAVVGLIYTFLRNFKSDMNIRFDSVADRIDKLENRIDRLETKITILDSRVARIEGHLYGMHWQPKIIEREEK